MSAGNGRASFTVPVDWQATQAGEWMAYHPAGDTQTFIAIKVNAQQGMTNEALAQQYFALLQANTNVSNAQIGVSEPYFIGDEAWYRVSFTYHNAGTGLPTSGAYFVTTVGMQEYVFWLEGPAATFDWTWQDVFSVIVDSLTFNG